MANSGESLPRTQRLAPIVGRKTASVHQASTKTNLARRTSRQRHADNRPLSGGTADLNLAAVVVDDGFGDGQSEPGPFSWRLGCEERREDAVEMFWQHPRACVADLQDNPLPAVGVAWQMAGAYLQQLLLFVALVEGGACVQDELLNSQWQAHLSGSLKPHNRLSLFHPI